MALTCRRKLLKILKLLRYYNTSELESEIQRITVPQRIKEFEQKKKVKQEIENRKKKININAPRIISCKNPEFNHHKGQTYSGFNPSILASHLWKSRNSAGDYFTINNHQMNPAFQHEKDKQQFADLQLNEHLIQILEKMNIKCPTVIQSRAIPKILNGDSAQIAAETGSGKTLAYLLPIMEMIWKQKKTEGEFDMSAAPNSPRCIIIVPTKELVEQVKAVADNFAPTLELSIQTHVHGPGIRKQIRNSRKSDIDILISTTGTVLNALSKKLIIPSYLQHLVLDEADTLLDDSFSSEVRAVINKLGVSQNVQPGTSSPAGMQLVMVSATLPRSVKDALGGTFSVENIEKITTSSLHHLMPHVPQTFKKLKPSQKPEEIIMLSKKLYKKGTPSMLFCNTHGTSIWLSKFLEEHSIPNTLMSSRVNQQERHSLFEKFQNEEFDLLVCTDIASRGLDTIRVEHVVNYDFPNFMSDYIHRAGRVGRVGSQNPGQVTSFVTYDWEVDLLWQLETAARRSAELHNVNANIKRKLVGRAEINSLQEEERVKKGLKKVITKQKLFKDNA